MTKEEFEVKFQKIRSEHTAIFCEKLECILKANSNNGKIELETLIATIIPEIIIFNSSFSKSLLEEFLQFD